MVENRPDWCISRQRLWGVPITMFYCKDCEQRTHDARRSSITSSRWSASTAPTSGSSGRPKDLMPAGIRLPELQGHDVQEGDEHSRCLVRFRREPRRRPRDTGPISAPRADMYLEGSDQHRGWFHSSLLESVGTRGRAPYKTRPHPRLRRRRRREEDVQVRGQRHRPPGDHRQVRRRDPAPLGGRRGLHRRHPHLRRDPEAPRRGLPPDPQHEPLHPGQPLRFRSRRRT